VRALPYKEGMQTRLTLLRKMVLHRAKEGDPEGGDRADTDDVSPVLVVMGGLHDLAFNTDEVFRKSLAPGAGVEGFVRAARDVGFSRVVWELIAATNVRVGKARKCVPGNPYQLPNDRCFQARQAVATNAKVRAGASRELGAIYLSLGPRV